MEKGTSNPLSNFGLFLPRIFFMYSRHGLDSSSVN